MALSLLTGLALADGKATVGWIERVALTSDALQMEAKVDTGADYSSVHADGVRYFDRDGSRWVEFALYDQQGKHYLLQRPLERVARIKKKTGGALERPVVVLDLCIGGVRHQAQFNLAERGHFKYPLLLGRDFLKDRFLVDSSHKYLLTPACE